MPLTAILSIRALGGAPASAQLADTLSRRLEPNALDRAVPPRPIRSATHDSLFQAERQRAEQQARAATGAHLPPSSTLNDGPAGVQRVGSGVAAPPTPLTPPPPPR